MEVGMRVSSVKFLSVASWAGIVFFCLMFNAAASASTETVLYTFSGSPDGSAPYSPLVSDKKGNLYGVTAAGGTNRQGAVYEISPTPEGGLDGDNPARFRRERC
jgi:uncharacterized repeat protein (TIGR03803 family)